MDEGIMKPMFIAKLTEDKAEVLEAIPLNKEYDGKTMVKVLKTGFIYYEKITNIASTRENALEILQCRVSNLTNQIKELWNKK